MLVAFLSALCWGVIVVINKRTLHFVDPIALNFFLRLPSIVFIGAATSLLTLLKLWDVGFDMTWQAVGYICLSSLVTWLIAFNTYFLALRAGAVGVVTPIIASDPVFTALFSAVLLGAGLRALTIAGLVATTTGVVLLSRWMGSADEPHGEVLAAPAVADTSIGAPRRVSGLEVVALSVVTAAGWGLSPVLISLAQRSLGGVSATMVLQSQALGMLLLAPLVWRRRSALFTHRLSAGERRLVVRLVILTGLLEALFSVLFFLLIDRIGPMLTVLIGASSPIFSIVGGVIWLKERFAAKLALAAAITLLGVALATLGGRP